VKTGGHEISGPHASARRVLHDGMFGALHGNRLVYNATWEDPHIDRALLRLSDDSEVVAITSAGCNILDMLLDRPRAIHAVDVNPRQNHLLELKMALIAEGNFGDLFQFFGIGSHPQRREVFARISHRLGADSASYWSRRLGMFSGRGLRPSFYWRGTTGLAAWSIWRAVSLLRINLRGMALALFDATTLEEQKEIFDMAEPLIWRGWMDRFLSSPGLMSLVGVPAAQTKLIDHSHPGGLAAYIRDKFRQVMTRVPSRDNYFWHVYTTGSYTLECCPNYLRRQNLEPLAALLPRIGICTGSITQFLQTNPGKYSHFVLLDHQDWLAWHRPEELREEWELILGNSRPGARIVLRSAGLNAAFIPADIRNRLIFHAKQTEPLHLTDRVGTYGSLHLAEVR